MDFWKTISIPDDTLEGVLNQFIGSMEDKNIGKNTVVKGKTNVIETIKINDEMRKKICEFGMCIDTYNLIQKKVFCILLLINKYNCTEKTNVDHNTLIETDLNEYRNIKFFCCDNDRFVLNVGNRNISCMSFNILNCILESLNNNFFIREKVKFVLDNWYEDPNDADFICLVCTYLFPKIEPMEKINMLEFLKLYYKNSDILSEVDNSIEYIAWEMTMYEKSTKQYIILLTYIINSKTKYLTINLTITKDFLENFNKFLLQNSN
jgi:Fe2+ transport system protein FeoA